MAPRPPIERDDAAANLARAFHPSWYVARDTVLWANPDAVTDDRWVNATSQVGPRGNVMVGPSAGVVLGRYEEAAASLAYPEPALSPQQVAKRALDLSIASFALLVSLPLLALIAFTILLDSGRPVLFRQCRVGWHGHPFVCLKFRTMVPDAEVRLADLLAQDPRARAEFAEHHKLVHDPRITPVGAFLRRSSLDELPQLINVLRGDMSLVGPRPVVDEELARYGVAAATVLGVRPGLTGLWQVSGRSDTSYERRVALDSTYVRHHSVHGDLWILVLTVVQVLSHRGAY
jgi:lipopolysaccharide/colanic/teichoic acid biosynthesis glycosyltransferase